MDADDSSGRATTRLPSPVPASEDEGSSLPKKTTRRIKKKLRETVASHLVSKNPPPDTTIDEATTLLAAAHLARAPAGSRSTLSGCRPPDEFLFSSDCEERIEGSFDEKKEDHEQLERDMDSPTRKSITAGSTREAERLPNLEPPKEAMHGVPFHQC